MNRENKRLEQKVKILKDPLDVCECIMFLDSFSISKEYRASYHSASK